MHCSYFFSFAFILLVHIVLGLTNAFLFVLFSSMQEYFTSGRKSIKSLFYQLEPPHICPIVVPAHMWCYTLGFMELRGQCQYIIFPYTFEIWQVSEQPSETALKASCVVKLQTNWFCSVGARLLKARWHRVHCRFSRLSPLKSVKHNPLSYNRWKALTDMCFNFNKKPLAEQCINPKCHFCSFWLCKMLFILQLWKP